MLVCAGWLAVDYLYRAGFMVTALPDGTRVAVRDRLSVPLPPVCGHTHCPPHPTTTTAQEAA